jgi:hypothetical protein
MENITFLLDFKAKLDKGDYDEHLNLPFMKKELLMAAVSGRIQRKIDKDVTPILTDSEILLCVNEVKEAAGGTFYLMVKHKILEEKEDGTYGLSRKGAQALREVSRL